MPTTAAGIPSVDGPQQPDILVVGHVSKDLLGAEVHGSYRLGGTVSYAAVTASRLGRRPTVVTRAAADIDLTELRAVAEVHVLSSGTTSTFANVYTPAGRVQYCYTPAGSIEAADIPAALRQPRAVLLGPIANEVAPDVVGVFAPSTVVAAVPQGWMRRFRSDGEVHHKTWESANMVLPHLALLVLSLEDIDHDISGLDTFCKSVPLVVLTEHRWGSTVHRRSPGGPIESIHVPPRPAVEVDPTGAGDVFATAFLIRWQETQDAVQAAWFANVAASFSIEQPGVAGIPSRKQVEEYVAAHPFGSSGTPVPEP
eukprot:GGOE01065317.1.p1 GENE.GGOE01065317.1~~GGOE01065317.1.p1  ORF type:complete len:312 (-),score=66.06 GGOE01065317.1:289-1224(-)